MRERRYVQGSRERETVEGERRPREVSGGVAGDGGGREQGLSGVPMN
jgi:hypothetical protein